MYEAIYQAVMIWLILFELCAVWCIEESYGVLS